MTHHSNVQRKRWTIRIESLSRPENLTSWLDKHTFKSELSIIIHYKKTMLEKEGHCVFYNTVILSYYLIMLTNEAMKKEDVLDVLLTQVCGAKGITLCKNNYDFRQRLPERHKHIIYEKKSTGKATRTERKPQIKY